MISLRDFPRLVKGALVTLDSSLNTVTSTILFQYNPDTLTRTLQVQSIGREQGTRSEALRLQGPPVETIQLDAEFETTGPLPDSQSQAAPSLGIYPQLSALETLIYPTTAWAKENITNAERGIVEIIPAEAPMTLLIWGRRRVLPVRLTNFKIAEEAYDANLNPVRAKVSLSLRVLSYNDLPWDQGKKLFLPHHLEKEEIAKKGRGIDLSELRLEGVKGTNISQLL